MGICLARFPFCPLSRAPAFRQEAGRLLCISIWHHRPVQISSQSLLSHAFAELRSRRRLFDLVDDVMGTFLRLGKLIGTVGRVVLCFFLDRLRIFCLIKLLFEDRLIPAHRALSTF